MDSLPDSKWNLRCIPATSRMAMWSLQLHILHSALRGPYNPLHASCLSWLSSWYISLKGRVLVRSPNENCSLPETSMPVIIEIRGVVVVLYCWVGEGVVVVDSQCQAIELYLPWNASLCFGKIRLRAHAPYPVADRLLPVLHALIDKKEER